MFGKEYKNHLDILTQSFGEMNENYETKLRKKKKNTYFLNLIKKLYISLFGIPEIGFQMRSVYFKNIISRYVPQDFPKNILDAGSGIGAYTFWLAKMYPQASVTGGEIDSNKLHSAKIIQKELKIDTISFEKFDLTQIDKKKKYDLIVIIDVLEHIPNYKQSFKNLYTLLQKGGYLYIHVPQPKQKRIFASLKSWHHDDHVYEGFSKKTLETEFKKLGCKILISKQTYGFFGKLAWELNHLTLSKSFILTGITFPILYILCLIDANLTNKNGLGMALLVEKND